MSGTSAVPMVLTRGHRTGTGHVRDTRGHAYFLVTQTIQFAPVDTQTMIMCTVLKQVSIKNFERKIFYFVTQILLDKIVVGGQVPLMTQKQGHAQDM